MTSLARRLRRRFPTLLERPYFPKRYPIISTQVRTSHTDTHACPSPPTARPQPQPTATNRKQVARASQSASAFALGFFDRGAANAAARPQPVAVSMLPKRADAVLRFFECPAYLRHEDTVERWLVSFRGAGPHLSDPAAC
jgi:hypothetical protein